MADDSSNDLLAGLAGLGGIASIGSGWAQSEALNAQASFAVSQAKLNQQFAGYRAQDVLRQGSLAADRIRSQGKQVLGAQRSSAAAQGIRVDEGSAGDAELQTRELSADDQITTRNNAWREAYGIQMQAQQNVNQAKLAQSGARAAAAGTLLGGALGGMQAAGRMAGYLNTSKLPVMDKTMTAAGTQDVTRSYDQPINDEFDGDRGWFYSKRTGVFSKDIE